MFNDFDQKPNDFVMSDNEIKSHKKVFSRLCLAFLAYLVIANGLSIALSYILLAIAPDLLKSGDFSLIASSVIQYVIAFPALWLILRKMPRQTPFASKLATKRFLKYAAVSVFIMYIGNYIPAF